MTVGNAQGVAIDSGHLYLADGQGGLRIFSLMDPARPSEVAQYNPVNVVAYSVNAEDIAIDDTSAYLACDDLHVVDIANPRDPKHMGYYRGAAPPYSVAVHSGYAYCPTMNGLEIVSIANPSMPTLAGSFWPPGEADSMDDGFKPIAISGGSLFYEFRCCLLGISSTPGLVCVDLSDPVDPELLWSRRSQDELETPFQLFYGEFDGRRRKRVMVKIIGE